MDWICWEHWDAASKGLAAFMAAFMDSKKRETAKPQAGAHSPSPPRQLAAHVLSAHTAKKSKTSDSRQNLSVFPLSRFPRTASRPFAVVGQANRVTRQH